MKVINAVCGVFKMCVHDPEPNIKGNTLIFFLDPKLNNTSATQILIATQFLVCLLSFDIVCVIEYHSLYFASMFPDTKSK
jgi:hypothetical protein